MKNLNISGALLAVVTTLFISCSTDSPDTLLADYINQEGSLDSWVNGIDKNMAVTVSAYAELLDMATDNYYNNYSRSNREFDKPNILYTDEYVEGLQRYVGRLREMSDMAFEKLSAKTKATDAQLQSIYTAKAYAYILAGENFVALPSETDEMPVSPEQQLHKAIEVLNEAKCNISSPAFIPVYNTLMARIYRQLGDKTQTAVYATAALQTDATFAAYVGFDEDNGVISYIKDRTFSANWLEPLPRLDFLDPKFQDTKASQRMAYAKAEEDYLILAECAAATSTAALDEFKQSRLPQLFNLIKSRQTATFTDNLEMRKYTINKQTVNLNSSEWKVKASPEDEAKSGLILNRATDKITVPSLSGTSLTLAEMQAAQGDKFLELLYLLRQEVFFAEGRRFADLGMRLPLCKVEAVNLERTTGQSMSAYTKAFIPPYIPSTQYAMDAFTVDAQTKTVTITYNMNRLLVEHKHLDCVAPFE